MRTQLETGAFKAAWEEGYAMTAAEAAAFALHYVETRFGL